MLQLEFVGDPTHKEEKIGNHITLIYNFIKRLECRIEDLVKFVYASHMHREDDFQIPSCFAEKSFCYDRMMNRKR